MKYCEYCGYTLNYPNFTLGCDGTCKGRKEYATVQEMKNDMLELKYVKEQDSEST